MPRLVSEAEKEMHIFHIFENSHMYTMYHELLKYMYVYDSSILKCKCFLRECSHRAFAGRKLAIFWLIPGSFDPF